MNLRILKKLSKRAATYLSMLGDKREQFPSSKDDNYHGMIIRARKHAERWPSCHDDTSDRVMVVTRPKCRASNRFPVIKLMQPSHPRKGTMMVGSTSGGYESEWDEECAWAALSAWVWAHYTDWTAYADDTSIGRVMLRDLSSIGKIFAAADDMIADRNQPPAEDWGWDI